MGRQWGAAASTLAQTSSSGPIIKGDEVSYLGWRNQTTGIDNFLGIPFAQPPIGPLRFKPPVPWSPNNQSQLVNATSYGPACEQASSVITRSEDCLTLDIYKPTNVAEKLPVMVWIYGGAWTAGSSAEYAGSEFVPGSIRLGKPVVFVSINYRLGTFGFPPGQAAADAGIINLGLKDQRVALEWVQKNIGYFGGDPTKVTIFGESAGAVSCGYHSLYKGGDIGAVFRGMILESGSPEDQIRRPNDQPREIALQALLNVTQCTDATDSYECLRNAPSELVSQGNIQALQAAPGAVGPVIYEGDDFLPELPTQRVRDGKFAKVPFVNGAQLDEGTLLSDVSSPETEQDILNILITTGAYGIKNLTAAQQLISYYPADPSAGSPYGTGNETFGFAAQWKRLASITGDAIIQAHRRLHLQSAVKYGVPTWSYLFTEAYVEAIDWIPYGVFHTNDIFFVFQRIHNSPNATAGLIGLEEAVLDYWTTFAYNLDPNPTQGKRPYWPQYGNNATLLQLASNISIASDTFRQEAMEFIESPYLYN